MYITIVEDEKILSSKVAKKLNKNWYHTVVYNSFEEFMINRSNSADLYILDLSLEDWSWFDIIKYLRKEKKVDTPIIITSAYCDIDSKIYGLDLWADDYIPKPFSWEELIARIRSLFRRSFKVDKTSIIKYKSMRYDTSSKLMTKKGEIIKLTARESQLVEFALFNRWDLLTRTQIINSVWWEHDTLKVSDNNINVTIKSVRKKLWDEFDFRTVINKGYILK